MPTSSSRNHEKIKLYGFYPLVCDSPQKLNTLKKETCFHWRDQEGVHPIPEPDIHVYSKRINRCPDKHTGEEERVE